ncbi:HAAS signaling domain-containing protein [Paenibacillus sp. LPE1-1-1.1]|uniref:HAAS signaling domain-containing protein n=1 Tax=Paenibacillus sp. LPE1-1-1.1 TaxID=3135230 RepID=UPI00342D240C
MTTRDRYMLELEGMLKVIPEAQRKEWLYDYYIHFQQAVENGQSEEDAARELGDPRMIANELLLGYRVGQAEKNNSFGKLSKAVFATVSLGLFNVIFILGPYLALAAVLLALWASAVAIGVAGIGIVIESLWNGTFTIPQALTIGLISSAITILLVIGLKALTTSFYKMTLKYLKFNTRIVKGNNK